MAEFARQRGYNPGRLEYWQRRDQGEARAVESAQDTPGLVPAVITGLSRTAVTISFTGKDLRLEIEDPSAVHPAWLAELATALRGGVAA